MLLIETHCHSNEISACAVVTAAELLAHARAAGFQGIALTNHYSEYNIFTHFKEEPRVFCERFIRTLDAAKWEGERRGMRVFSACEVSLNRYEWRDIILAGDVAPFLRACPEPYRLTQAELFARASAFGLFAYHAHPFRAVAPETPEARYLHGIEVYNAHTHAAGNAAARKFARAAGLTGLYGTDYHGWYDGTCAGIYIPDRVKTDADYAAFLHKGRFKHKVFPSSK